MKTVQMTLDEDLILTVDKFVKSMHTTRSAFTGHELQQAIARIKIQKQEEKHAKGYSSKPVASGEFDVWEKEQKWSNE